MNAFLRMASAITGRLGTESSNVALVAQVVAKAERFQERIDAAEQDHIRYPESWGCQAVVAPEEAIILETRQVIEKAMCRLDATHRESLVYWVLQEVAARIAVEKMAAQHERLGC